MVENSVDEKPELITVNELAAYLKCTPDAVYNLIRREKLGERQGVFHPLHKRSIRISLTEFLHWRGSVKLEAPAPPAACSPIDLLREVLGVLMPFETRVSELAVALHESIARLQKLYELDPPKENATDWIIDELNQDHEKY